MYVKIFAQIFHSTLAEDYETRHIFMDLLVLADPAGIVDMTDEAIARATNIPISKIQDALCKLGKPDVNSRSEKADGRRIVPLDPGRNWGWQIVNFEQYRNMRDENARREYMRTYMKERRAAEKRCKQRVNRVNIGKLPLAQEEADAVQDAEEETASEETASVSRSKTPPSLSPFGASGESLQAETEEKAREETDDERIARHCAERATWLASKPEDYEEPPTEEALFGPLRPRVCVRGSPGPLASPQRLVDILPGVLSPTAQKGGV